LVSSTLVSPHDHHHHHYLVVISLNSRQPRKFSSSCALSCQLNHNSQTMQTRSSAKRAKLPLANEKLVGSDKAQLVMPDLTGAICLDDTTFSRSLYRGLASEPSIDVFLKKSRSYEGASLEASSRLYEAVRSRLLYTSSKHCLVNNETFLEGCDGSGKAPSRGHSHNRLTT
jgi:hypothetical protein